MLGKAELDELSFESKRPIPNHILKYRYWSK